MQVPASQKETPQEKFENWKRDLLKRLDEHLKKKPETENTPKAIAPKLLNTRIEVIPSDGDSWIVKLNGNVLLAFYGPLAHREATRYASAVANSAPSEQVVVPTACLFCGGRGSHRPGCSEISTSY